MTLPRLADANLIIRFFVQDNEKQARIAEKLFAASDRGELQILVLPAVLAECVFVLESFYDHQRGDIVAALSKLITSPGVKISEMATHLDALARYSKTTAHFVDCVIAATAVAQEIPIATFDRDFRRFADVQVNLD